jgi:hypothetical protein
MTWHGFAQIVGRMILTLMIACGFGRTPAQAVEPHSPAGPAPAKGAAENPEVVPTWLQAQDKSGSSGESEQAVDLALQWLAEHQMANGDWSFDHRFGTCRGRCSDPGSLAKAFNGATGMALLPFISHGNTHLFGPYRKTTAAGLQYLIAHMTAEGSLWEPGGTMYSHALGLFALCEDCRIIRETPGAVPSDFAPDANPSTAKGATGAKARPPLTSKARRLRDQEQQQQQLREHLVPNAAAKAMAFTLACQDPRLGGWRYDRHPDSDISVTGWHVVALYSATKAGLNVPPRPAQGVTLFLNAVQSNSGATYAYMVSRPIPSPTRSAIGLLCRVYTGWGRDQPGLQAGVEMLSKLGPSTDDMYYNYYCTLLLHHYGGPLWDDWNRKMREYLIRTQSHTGHEAGSWSFHDAENTPAGGRLLSTCLACLILETYYRSTPVYAAATNRPAEAKPADKTPATAGKTPAPAGKTPAAADKAPATK